MTIKDQFFNVRMIGTRKFIAFRKSAVCYYQDLSGSYWKLWRNNACTFVRGVLQVSRTLQKSFRIDAECIQNHSKLILQSFLIDSPQRSSRHNTVLACMSARRVVRTSRNLLESFRIHPESTHNHPESVFEWFCIHSGSFWKILIAFSKEKFKKSSFLKQKSIFEERNHWNTKFK